jgi:hypothetical protein
MREMNFDDLNKQIQHNKSEVEKQILEERTEKLVRTRIRDKDEADILDKLCTDNWNKALKEGKIKYLSKREWYYDPS